MPTPASRCRQSSRWPPLLPLLAAGLLAVTLGTAAATIGPQTVRLPVGTLVSGSRTAADKVTEAAAATEGVEAAAATEATEATGAAEVPPPPREFRGAWIATVANIDWPSRPGLTAEQQKQELLALLDRAAELRLNAVIFQVRPMADALYESALEPWSEFLTGRMGQSPGYDPLAFAITAAHARGLELHAWFNPYRARHPSSRSPISDKHLIRRHPEWVKTYGTHQWMNPTHPDVAAHTLAVIRDVVRRYDIDGVHIDDYFYPYRERGPDGQLLLFPDEDTWQKYRQEGGTLGRDDWRRAAINAFVRDLYREVKALKPWVKVGISPFGIWRPNHPPGITGLDAFAELYADARLWFQEGWCDYLAPQLYWPIAQPRQSFPKLLAWWAEQNTQRRHLWPGLYTSRVRERSGESGPKGWPAQEIAEQIALVRQQRGASGAIHFSIKALRDNPDRLADHLRRLYADVALVPAIDWSAPRLPLGLTQIPPPRCQLLRQQQPPALRISSPPDTRFLVLRHRTERGWTTRLLPPPSEPQQPLHLPLEGEAIPAVAVLDRFGRLSPFVLPE